MDNVNMSEWAQKKSMPPQQVQEEFSMLMSLALDGLLDEEEQATFDIYLSSYPLLAREWQDWQMLDAQLQETPSAAPPADFLLNFDVRLLQQERRRRLWLGFAFGAVTISLWLTVMIGLASLGAYVLLSQPACLTQFVHSLAYVYASVTNGVANIGATTGAILGTNEARTFGLVYLFVSASMVGTWILFLRRSTRISVTAQAA